MANKISCGIVANYYSSNCEWEVKRARKNIVKETSTGSWRRVMFVAHQ